MKKYQGPATIIMRFALATGFLSAVASRLSLWGSHSSGWAGFLDYTKSVNSFAPASLVSILAVMSTILETSFAILLLIGYKTRWAALGTSVLTLFFALSMAYSFGLKEPLDYSVFAFSASAFLLSTIPDYPLSIDQRIKKMPG
ncbi:MAG TPA: DoxX family protein [Puia sp.]|nr:DoxX family protein [Puia sp.]